MPAPSTHALATRPSALARFMSWIGRSGRLEVAILIAIFVVVAGFWTFGLLAAEVMDGDTRKFDERVLLSLRQPSNLSVPIGPRWTLQVARDITAFGSAVGIGLVTLIVSGYLGLQRRFSLLSFVLASVVSATLLSVVLKNIFHRPRPQVVPHLTDIASASFPSGHSMMSSMVYLTLAALLARTVRDMKTKVYFFVVASVLTGLIGLSRLYLGVHFPTDVLAGWCIGCSWAAVCSLAAHYLSRHASIPHAEELSDQR